jgi:phosphohistidine phosphatase SixA
MAGEDGEVWRLLYSERRVTSKTARRIIQHLGIEPSSDALFPEASPQTWGAKAQAHPRTCSRVPSGLK